MSNVYLGGTITPDPKYAEWRKYVAAALYEYGINAIDPMRGKDITDCTDLKASHMESVWDNGGFVARDYRDIFRSDLLFILFEWLPDRQSIGTWAEMGFAYGCNIPYIVISQIPEVVNHPFVWKKAAKVCKDRHEGIDYARFLLGEA